MTDILKRDVILSFISWFLILLLAVAGLGIISRCEGYEFPGDGYEYLMMPVSILNHGSTSVTDEDIDEAKSYYGNDIFDTIYRTREDITLVQGSDGNSYAKHFYIYSVLCMPLRSLFSVAGLNPAKAFLMMNLFFWFTACAVVQLFLDTEQWRKTLLMIFLVVNPCWFYMTWVHTEILMFSLVVISLVLRYNGKFALSMLMMSIASMSNLALLVPAFVLGLDFLYNTVKAEGKSVKKILWKTWPVILAAVPGFIPVIRSYILFGSYSPVAAVASVGSSSYPTDNRLICALSYLTDPNQGMIIYTLLIVPFFIGLVIVNIIKRQNISSAIFTLLAIAGMLFVVSFELHINCGMSYIMRYNVWILPFMAFYNAFNLKWQIATPVFTLSGIWTFAVILLLTVFTKTDMYLGFTPFGKTALNDFTGIYNPPVGIFYSRALTVETYYSDNPVAYFDDEGNLHKILLTNEAASRLDSGEWNIYGPDNEIVDYRDLDMTNINGEEFTYVNISEDGYHIVRDTDRLVFSNRSDTDEACILSDVGYEGDTALIYGNEMDLLFHINPGSYTGIFSVANVFGGVQNITVIVNGQTVFEGPVSMDDQSFAFDFEVGNDYLCDIKVLVPGALSPQSVIPDSNDDRVLSLYLRDFTYEAH